MTYDFIKKTDTHIWGHISVGGTQVQVHVLFDKKGADIEFYKHLSHGGHSNFYRNKPNATRSGKSLAEVVEAINKFFNADVLDDIRLVNVAGEPLVEHA